MKIEGGVGVRVGCRLGLGVRAKWAWSRCFLICCLLIMAFLPRKKCLLISWLQLSSAVILEPKKIKSVSSNNKELGVSARTNCNRFSYTGKEPLPIN